ncbi:MAG: glycerophosphodiester phosphodiesterase [Mycobacteriaceae bacterium]|uniref:glycerophosphodiester phosphodiesterase n=1 Tax=Corynebacterium sp. TaxID=1720 RepID=UPI003F9CC2FB
MRDVKIIAHRGASGYRPELTPDAYEHAADLHADGFECDIRLSADGVPVIIHDATVDRTSDGSGAVAGKPLAELKELNFGTPERPQQILTLRELLDFTLDQQSADYRPELFVETKRLGSRGERAGQLETAFNRELHGMGLDRSDLVHLISFDHGSLARFRDINPHIHRIYLRKEYRLWMALRHAEHAAVAPSQGFSVYRARVAPGAVVGDASNTYLFTANREDDLLWAYRHGVEWVATDYPDRAREVTRGAIAIR